MTPPATSLRIPRAAIRYILLQRTQFLSFLRSPRTMRVFLALDRLCGGDGRNVFASPVFGPAVRLEGALRAPVVGERYAAEIVAEYERLKPHLPARCRAVVDIGCGVAAIDTLLYRHFAASPPSLYLVDRTTTAERIHYGFAPSGAFYNSLAVARRLLVANGVPNDRIHTVEVAPNVALGPPAEVDVVISLISWGFHYPVAIYLDQVHALLAAGGRLILDVRRGTGGEAELETRFGSVRVIEEHPKHVRMLAIKTGTT